MHIRRGTALIVVGIAAILLLALILVVPPLINVDRYRPQVISYLQEKTGKRIEIGRLALTFFPVTIHVDHLGVKNPPIFPAGYVIEVGRIDEGEVRLGGEIAHSLRPLAGIRGAGHLTVRNGQVPSLKLNANLMKLAHFNDLGPAKNDPSSFNLITTDLELADQRISSRVIDIDGYGVDVDGSGSVSVSGSDELNYRGLAEITTKESFFTNTIARLSGATLKEGKLQFPFRIGGTIDNPLFSKGKGDKDVDAVQR
jgi:hypothetical protein